MHYLSFRPRSRQEVLRNLRDKGYLEAHIEAALARLEGYGYVDDQEFARFWLENRTRFKPRSVARRSL
ncbi:MAG: hypothetical protein HC802_11555 [Caldilineaceae bacterium]|nr:hypothetical protein [Caldilineaceae bacterium]